MNEFDDKAKDWDSDPSRVTRAQAVALAIRRHVPLSECRNAMEYGCGTGLLSFLLWREIRHITLADSSEGMLEVLAGKIAASGAANMSPLKLDLAAGQLPDTRFDLVYTLMTLHHIPEFGVALEQFYALLEPGGWLAICDLDKEDGSFHGPGFDGHKGFDRGLLSSQLAAIGFADIEVTTAHEMERETPTGNRIFPLFLLVARKR